MAQSPSERRFQILQHLRHDPRGLRGDRDICACAIWANCYCSRRGSCTSSPSRPRAPSPSSRGLPSVCSLLPLARSGLSNQRSNRPKSLRLFCWSERASGPLQKETRDRNESPQKHIILRSKAQFSVLCPESSQKERIGSWTGGPRRPSRRGCKSQTTSLSSSLEWKRCR